MTLLVSGCASGTGGGPASPGVAGGPSASGALSFQEDTAESQTKTMTAKAGVSFVSRSAEGTAGLLVIAGAFPPNTKITFTPLKSAGDGVCAPGFKVTAEGGVQPRRPVFVAFTFKGEVPKDAVLVSYDDGGTKGVKVPASTATTGGVTTMYAQVDHFTIFRVDQDSGQDGSGASQTDQGAAPSTENLIKSWTIQINDSFPVPDESGLWTSDWTLGFNASNPYGNILGPYFGSAKLGLKGTAAIAPGVKGTMSGSWSGPVSFPKGRVMVIFKDQPLAPKPGEPDPQMGMLISCDGEFNVRSATPWKIRVGGRGMSGGYTAPLDKGSTYALRMTISDAGAFVIFPGGIGFRGVPTAVLK
ncbi:MAG TPA: hypothetical protein VIK31_07955 [Propionibacteriaceae bacterium]